METRELQLETAFRAGLAGTIVFSYTDDWWRGGRAIEDWQMGVTTRTRQPKPSFLAVQRSYSIAPTFPLRNAPKVSVVVASYNGERTLKACLQSLGQLQYPDYEVILVDDGSTDSTRQIAVLHPEVRYFRHEKNLGLSVARNTGIAAASGEIIAFTDADCRADEDWLYYLIGDLLRSDFAGIGGIVLIITMVLGWYVSRYQPRILRNHARSTALAVLLVLVISKKPALLVLLMP